MPSKTATRKPSKFALTPEQRKQRMDDATAMFATGVEGLMTSEGWQKMIAASQNVRGYSLNNLMMILMQCPEASDVRPLSVWSELIGERYEDGPRKGELKPAYMKAGTHRIKIWKPRFKKNEETGQDELAHFILVDVADISQLQNPPAILQAPRAAELTGAAPEELWDRIALQIIAKGYTVEIGEPGGSAYGVTDYQDRRVTILKGADPAQQVKTLIHELAHILCGHADRREESRARREVEAESVACVVAVVVGLPALEYSVSYVAGWADSTETVRASAKMVLKVSDEILSALGMDAKPAEAEEAVAA